jgi:hypothetical protein
MLEEEHLSGAGAVGEARLCLGAFLTAERRIGQHNIEEFWRISEQAAVSFAAGEGVAMPEMWLVDAMEHEVGQCDGVNEVLLLAAIKHALAQRGELARRGVVAKARVDVVIALRQEAPCPAAGIVDGLAEFGINGLDDGTDDLARGEELAAVVAFLAHAQQQSLVDLREGKDVLRIHAVQADGVHAVEHVEEVALGIHAHTLDAGEDLADDQARRFKSHAHTSGCQPLHLYVTT